MCRNLSFPKPSRSVTAMTNAEDGASSPATREGLLDLVGRHERVLEIGPFTSPVVPRERAAYFDVLDQAALRRRALEQGQDPNGVPEIDYVSPTGNMSVIAETVRGPLSRHMSSSISPTWCGISIRSPRC